MALFALIAVTVTPVSPTAAITTSGGCGLAVSSPSGGVRQAVEQGLGHLVAAGDEVRGLTFSGDVVGIGVDGLVDTSWGTDGLVTGIPDVAATFGFPDGGLLVVSTAYEGARRLELLRLDGRGRPDTRIGPAGRASVPLGGTADGSAYGVGLAELADGDLLLTTRTDEEGVLVRLDRAGRPRTSFGIDGVAGFALDDRAQDRRSPRGTAEMPDGELVVLGTRTQRGTSTTTHTAVAWRFDADGVQDLSFGVDGLLHIDGFVGGEVVTAVDGTTLLAAGPVFTGEWAISVVDLASAEVTHADDTRHRIRTATRVGDRVYTAAASEVGFLDLVPASAVRRSLDGTPDPTYGDAGLREASFDRYRLAGPVQPAIHPDGSVTFLATADDWAFGEQVLAVLRIGPDGAVPAGHGWCPDGDGPSTPRVARIAGPDRFATAVALSREGYPEGADTVVIATGTNFPDALAGGPAAAAWRAPVLLVRPGELGSTVAEELRRLDPTRVVLLGGPAAVSPAVADEVTSVTGLEPERIAGGNRYETAVAIAEAAFPSAATAFVTTGQNFPDALAAGAIAGTLGGPVLLTTRDGVPDPTRQALDRLGPSEVVVVGGRSAVGPTFDQLHGRGLRVEPVEGRDRYETARRLNDRFRTEQDGHLGRPLSTVFLATGQSFPDALAGSALAGVAGGIVSLVPTDAFDERIRSQLGRSHPRTIYVLGGPRAVGDVWVDTLRQPGATSFAYIDEPFEGSDPIRWNPCEPIPWVFDASRAPEGGLELVVEGLSRITESTGWEFAFEGTTDEPVRLDRAAYQPDRYGDRWAPVAIGWGDTSFGDVAGEAGPTWVDGVHVSGTLVLSRTLTLPMTFEPDGWGPILLHEVGHVLGLDHPGDPRQLMWWITQEDVADLGDGDVAGLRRLRQGGCLEAVPPFRADFVRSATRG